MRAAQRPSRATHRKPVKREARSRVNPGPLHRRHVGFLGFSPHDVAVLVAAVKALGGYPVQGHVADDIHDEVDILIVPLRYRPRPIDRRKPLYTTLWIDTLSFHKKYVDPATNPLFKPINAGVKPDLLNGVIATSSGLDALEKAFCRLVVTLFGGVWEEQMTKARTTHLVTDRSGGFRESAALAWEHESCSNDSCPAKIHIVGVEWAWHIAYTGEIRPSSSGQPYRGSTQASETFEEWLFSPPPIPKIPSSSQPLHGCIIQISTYLLPFKRSMEAMIYYLGGKLHPGVAPHPTHIIGKDRLSPHDLGQDLSAVGGQCNKWGGRPPFRPRIVSVDWLWKCFKLGERAAEQEFSIAQGDLRVR